MSIYLGKSCKKRRSKKRSIFVLLDRNCVVLFDGIVNLAVFCWQPSVTFDCAQRLCLHLGFSLRIQILSYCLLVGTMPVRRLKNLITRYY